MYCYIFVHLKKISGWSSRVQQPPGRVLPPPPAGGFRVAQDDGVTDDVTQRQRRSRHSRWSQLRSRVRGRPGAVQRFRRKDFHPLGTGGGVRQAGLGRLQLPEGQRGARQLRVLRHGDTSQSPDHRINRNSCEKLEDFSTHFNPYVFIEPVLPQAEQLASQF